MSGALREVVALAPSSFAAWTARVIDDAIRAAVASRGVCRLVLAGGRTPAAVYRVLATHTDVPWSDVHVYIGDERCVPPTHADSNYRMIDETLLSAVPVPVRNVHRLRGEAGAVTAASEYEALLAPLPLPLFDLVLTGVGADGHTASLFPGDVRVTAEQKWAMTAVAPPAFAVSERVGLSLRALCSTRVACVLCTGDDKRAIRTAILGGDAAAQRLPAALVTGQERTLWIVDPR